MDQKGRRGSLHLNQSGEFSPLLHTTVVVGQGRLLLLPSPTSNLLLSSFFCFLVRLLSITVDWKRSIFFGRNLRFPFASGEFDLHYR